jgi:hypothetical protein
MKTTLFATATAAAATVLFSAPGFAQTLKFGADGIQFEKDTWIQFTFKENGGWFDSTLAVYEIMADGSASKVQDLLGEEEEAQSSFTFTAGKIYSLGLTNYDPDGNRRGKTIYTTSSLNWGYKNGGAGYQQALFGQQEEFPTLAEGGGTAGNGFANPGDYGSADPLRGNGAKIAFEDSGMPFGADGDYNDFVVHAAPEPITMTGMALGGAGLFAARRRRRQRKQG